MPPFLAPMPNQQTVDADQDPMAQRLHARFVHRVGQDAKFIAAEPGDNVFLAHLALQTEGHSLQDDVAEGMAEAIVQRLETVEVDEKQAEVAAVLFAGQEPFLKFVLQKTPIEKLGERIENGLLAPDLRFRLQPARLLLAR